MIWKTWHKWTLGGVGAILAGCCGLAALGTSLDDPADNVTPSPVVSASGTTAPSATPSPSPRALVKVSPSPTRKPPAPPPVYYKNCDAVRAAGKAPLYRGQPGYRSGLDHDNDGIACDR
jgi:hypothetical protein